MNPIIDLTEEQKALVKELQTTVTAMKAAGIGIVDFHDDMEDPEPKNTDGTHYFRLINMNEVDFVGHDGYDYIRTDKKGFVMFGDYGDGMYYPDDEELQQIIIPADYSHYTSPEANEDWGLLLKDSVPEKKKAI